MIRTTNENTAPANKGNARPAVATAPGVVILGNEYQALGHLRQVKSENINCVLVDQDSWGVARLSRYRCPFYRSPRYDSADFWPWLVNSAERHGWSGWVLIPTEDEQVRQIAEHYPEATKLFRYCGPSWDQFRLLYDKRLTYDWAACNGICIPQTISLREKPELIDRAMFPLIVKPAVKRTYSHYTRQKAFFIASPSDLQELLSNVLRSVPVEDLLCQEIIPGDGRYQWSYAGFFLDGQPIAAFTACRRRQHPLDFGRSSTYVMAERDDEVECESRKVLALLRYSGLAEVEWKRDPRDGKLRLLEVNARSWGWHSLASRVVGNLPKMLYDYLVDGVATPVQARYGSRWVKWITDVPVVAELLRRRELTWTDYLCAVRQIDVWCEWGRGDPLPFLLQGLLVPYIWLKRGY